MILRAVDDDAAANESLVSVARNRPLRPSPRWKWNMWKAWRSDEPAPRGRGAANGRSWLAACCGATDGADEAVSGVDGVAVVVRGRNRAHKGLVDPGKHVDVTGDVFVRADSKQRASRDPNGQLGGVGRRDRRVSAENGRRVGHNGFDEPGKQRGGGRAVAGVGGSWNTS